MSKRNKTKIKLSNVMMVAGSLKEVSDNITISGDPNLEIYSHFFNFTNNTELLESILKEKFPSIKIFNETNKIVMSVEDLQGFIYNKNNYIKEYVDKRGIDSIHGHYELYEYCKQRRLFVRPEGVAKWFNLGSTFCVSTISVVNVVWTTATAQISGLSGVALVTAYPACVIAVPTLFGFGFSYLECLTRGTILQAPCQLAARGCLIPLKLSEIFVNQFLLPIPNRFRSVPLIINTTDTVLNGYGIDYKLVRSFISKAHDASKDRNLRKILKKVFIDLRGGI